MKQEQNIIPQILLMLLLSCVVTSAQPSTQQSTQQPSAPLPAGALKFGVFVARFDPGGTFTLQGARWPTLNGKWIINGAVIEFTMTGGPEGCDGTGRYEFRVEEAAERTGRHVSFKLIADDCDVRRMIVDGSVWRPADEARAIPIRRIRLTPGARLSSKRASEKPERNLAVVSRAAGFGHRGEAKSARSLGRQDRRKHSLANSDSRARAFEPDRLGQSDLSSPAPSAAIRKPLSGPASTATATPRKIARFIAG